MRAKSKGWWERMSRSARRWLILASAGIFIIILWIAYLMIFRGYTWPTSGFEGKTVWDWLELLIIPFVLGIGALLFNRSEKRTELKLADDRQKEQALQSYIDKMTELMINDRLMEYRDYLGEPVVKAARIRTVTTLRALDLDRKNVLLQFLRDSGLADFILIGASLRQADLSGADLSFSDLSEADLSEADLSWADLRGAKLSGAKLSGAKLFDATLKWAFLIGGDLSGAYLGGADLSSSNLSEADLSEADLSRANLTDAKVTDEQLAKAKSLKGATMPDGTKHE